MAKNLEPQAPVQDKTKLLYDAVSKDYNIGTYDDFSKKLQDSSKRKAFYDGVGTEYNLGTFDDFSAKIGGADLKKKDQEVSLSISSPTQSLSPDFEKGKTFAEKGFLMKPEGTKEQKRISIEPSFTSAIFGGAPNVKVLEEDEEPSTLADISNSVIKGQIQGKVANILAAGKKPTENELGELAQLQIDAQLLPQSKSEKLYQEKGLKGLFVDSPTLGVQFVAETMASSLSALFEASQRTVPAAVAMGAAAGAPFAGIGALVGAGTGLLAGQSAAGYNLSTSQDILNSLSDNGVDISNKESLIKAFSDEKKMAKIRNTAAKYGIPILAFDAATAGLAGKLAAGAIGKSLSKKLLAGLGETGIQVGGGMGGEFTGQLASGKKVNLDEIIMEGLAEVPGGAVEVVTGVQMERSKTASNNKTLATQIATQGVQNGAEDAVVNLNRDLANNVITPEQYQEGVVFVEKAAQVADKIPEAVTGENKAKSIELLVERNDIKQANDNLIQQKQTTDEAYHAGIDEEIKANDEKIKKLDSEVYNIAKKPSKEFGGKKYIVDGEEVSQAEFEAIQGKPIGTKEIIKAEVKPEKVTEEVETVKLDELPDRAFAVGMTVEKFEDLKSKIQKEGFTQPIIIDKESGNVLDGQSRLLVAQDLGIKDVPYIFMDNPTRADLNEKIKELEKQYIPSKEVKPAEVKQAPKKTYQEALKEKQAAEKKLTRQIAGEKAGVTRNIIKEASKIEPTDARSAALKRLAGGSLSWEAIDEVAGRVKGARLNTGEREFKSEEARSRDYVAKKGEGESLDTVAGNIWDNLSEEMQGKMDTQDVKNALISVVSEYNSKAEIAQALIDGYKEESIEELERKYYERFGDNIEIEIDKELNQVPKNQLDIEQELINANYESEQQLQDDYWNAKEATNNFTEKAPSAKAQKAETAKGLAEAYKDLTINQKRQIINSKFDELLKELKIEKICPT
jgi:ParB-like chromosome segregation protein Spo0J